MEATSAAGSQAPTARSTSPDYTADWDFGEFVNEWGEKTGKHFMVFKNRIDGTFTRLTLNNAPLSIVNLTFSNDDLSFNLHERGDRNSTLIIGTRSRIEVAVVMRIESIGERTFSGRVVDINKIIIDLNGDLLRILSAEEEINIRVTLSLDNSRAFYQFNFTPINFNNAHTHLNSL